MASFRNLLSRSKPSRCCRCLLLLLLLLLTLTLILQVLPADLTSIYLAKVDTEGGELAVLHALMPFILQKKVGG